jgi:hypothetical protein
MDSGCSPLKVYCLIHNGTGSLLSITRLNTPQALVHPFALSIVLSSSSKRLSTVVPSTIRLLSTSSSFYPPSHLPFSSFVPSFPRTLILPFSHRPTLSYSFILAPSTINLSFLLDAHIQICLCIYRSYQHIENGFFDQVQPAYSYRVLVSTLRP